MKNYGGFSLWRKAYNQKSTAIFHFSFLAEYINPFGIALCHFLFNVFTTAILLPFSKVLVKLANRIIPEKQGETEKATLLDERLFNTPSMDKFPVVIG